MQWMLEEGLGPEMVGEFADQITAFRRRYLVRVVALLAASAWAVGMVVLFFDRTTLAFVSLLGFEAVCFVGYRLSQHDKLTWAQHFLVVGIDTWLLAMVWLVSDPVMLFLPVLGAPIAVAVLPTRPALLYTVLVVVGQIAGAWQLAPDSLLAWQMLLPPLLTIEAAALAMVWRVNFDGVVGWAMHSTRSAIERLEETQEHRAQLHRSMERLDAAYQRLERVNEMLRVARAEAEAAHQARNQFALTVSHELRTPLNFIIGFSEMMINSPELYGPRSEWPQGLYEDIQEIYRSSSHLMRLVNDIIDLGQAEARRLILAKEWTTPEAIVLETEAIMRAAAVARHLYLQVEVEPDLPPLFVDRTRIRQVLINLIGNSLRFTEEGGISVRVRRRATDVLFSITDTGVGIPANEIPKVFEDFGQANTTVWRRRGGSGLGVPISHRFVKMHGGEMWLESEVSLGTTFYFTVPMAGSSRGTGTLDRLEREGGDGDFQRTSKPDRVVLVVSSDPTAVQYMETCLEDFRVVGAQDSGQAADAATRLLPHALVLDQALAAEDGMQVILDELQYDVPVVTLDLPGAPPPRTALPEGVRGHLVKPVEREQLVQTIRSLDRPVRSVLLVDDDPRMHRLVSLALNASLGAEAEADPVDVRAVHTGREALQLLGVCDNDGPGGDASGVPDVLLLDLALPDISGWDVLAGLHDSPLGASIPIVLVTAADLRDGLTGSERFSLEISRKRPFTIEELQTTLSPLLQSLRPHYPTGSDGAGRPADLRAGSAY